MTIHTVGYFINFLLLSGLLYWLLSTNHWTRGKKVLVTIVGIQTWNYGWACFNLLVNVPSLNTVNAYGYQFPTLIALIYVYYQLRGGDGRDS